MLSILIPIYNYNVVNFISELHKQAISEKIDFEIIAADDASDIVYQNINKKITKLQFVKYIQLQENIGRSKIRNFLAEQAEYNNLLFADCDMEISDNTFIKKYTDNLKQYSVICGGINYSETKPKNPELLLRWYYGQNREKIESKIRNTHAHTSFMSSNFLIRKKIFSSIKFNEKIKTYGHEDTLFGIELKRKNIPIMHINNNLIHKGLENSKSFIKKTENGIDNLIIILKEYKYPELINQIKLLKIAKKLYLFRNSVIYIFIFLKPLILKNLKSKKPKLFIFDFYKLSVYYIKIK